MGYDVHVYRYDEVYERVGRGDAMKFVNEGEGWGGGGGGQQQKKGGAGHTFLME